MASAEASGQSLLPKNSVQSILPIMRLSGPAQQVRDHELAHHRDEDQHAAGDDAGQRQRQGDARKA